MTPAEEPRGPINWGNHYAEQRKQPPARHTADTITDNDLDALYGELGLARHLLANVRQTCTGALNRAEKAERVAESAARDTAKALTDYLAAEQRAEQAEAERDKACTAFNAKVMQLEKANEERATLALLFEGFGRLLATSSRDWGAYRVDAWLWAVVLGWDCDRPDPCTDPECTHDTLEQFAREFGWDEAAVVKARRYNAAVRALTEPKEK